MYGGPKVRAAPLPYRKLFGQAELDAVISVFENSWESEADFGFQSTYETLYTEAFREFQGGGFADAVCSGSVAVYLALMALDLEPGSDVVVSPVTDPGGVSAVILAGMKPILADSLPTSFNTGPEQFEKALSDNTRAAVMTNVGGHSLDMDPIMEIAKSRNVIIIEDCSHAHGALYKGRKVGTFGGIAAFSTMFSKGYATGGCGGVVYTRNQDYYWRVRALADRGKPFSDPEFDPRDSSAFLFPSLNYNLDELSCAIGISTLSRLPETIERRLAIAERMDRGLERSRLARPCRRLPDAVPSPYYHTVEVDVDRLTVTKKEFAEAIAAEGVWINPHCRDTVAEWAWLRPYLKGRGKTPNAIGFRDRSFNILFNERFTDADADCVVESILKVEAALANFSGEPAR